MSARRAGLLVAGLVLVAALPTPLLAKPRSRPPAAPTRPAPPPVWVEARSGDRWLAFGSYCWSAGGRATCFDPLPPEARKDIPRIVLRRGEIVRFHLGSRPRALGLSIGRQIFTLPRVAAPRWHVDGKSGIALLYTKRASTVSYHARFVIR